MYRHITIYTVYVYTHNIYSIYIHTDISRYILYMYIHTTYIVYTYIYTYHDIYSIYRDMYICTYHGMTRYDIYIVIC